MPKICRKCKKQFPFNIKVDGVWKNLNSRQYCLECSPWKKHNTKVLETESQDKLICGQCGKEYTYCKSKGHTKKYCNSCSQRRRQQKIKKIFVEYKGGKCFICGYDKYIGALQFHHEDESKKEFGIAGRYNRKLSELKKKADKCVLLCANCHAEIHADIA